MKIVWQDSGRKAQCAPNPDFPAGVDLDCSDGAEKTCSEKIPYPAAGCGVYFVKCEVCGYTVAITAAGRPDDPRSIKMPCRLASEAAN